MNECMHARMYLLIMHLQSMYARWIYARRFPLAFCVVIAHAGRAEVCVDFEIPQASHFCST